MENSISVEPDDLKMQIAVNGIVDCLTVIQVMYEMDAVNFDTVYVMKSRISEKMVEIGEYLEKRIKI